MTTALLKTTPPLTPSFDSEPLVAEVCRLIPPLWPLQNFVAVNPFLGLADRHFTEACTLLAQIVPGGMQMGFAYYREKIRSGAISSAHLAAALARAEETPGLFDEDLLAGLDLDTLQRACVHPSPLSETDVETAPIVLTLAESIDQLYGTTWSTSFLESITHFCASYYDDGQSTWNAPWRTRSLYSAWLQQAKVDRHLELLGLAGFRHFVARLPEDPLASIVASLSILQLSTTEASDYLHRLLLSVKGWSGHIQYRVREKGLRGEKDDSLTGFLAILLACEAALFRHVGTEALRDFWPPVSLSTNGRPITSKRIALLYLLQLADECSWEEHLLRMLIPDPAHSVSPLASETPPRPSVQAVFCLDTRSEVYRRSLESLSPQISTHGFAGFFGLAIEYQALESNSKSSRCPGLVAPQYQIREGHDEAHADEHLRGQQQRSHGLWRGWHAFKHSAISCFSFVETTGLLFGHSLLRDGFLPRSQRGSDHSTAPQIDDPTESHCGIPSQEKILVAQRILHHLGLKENFARLVLFCGHGSETSNNPYHSGLNCGACGGHAGDTNARLGATLLNDPEVRLGLASLHGIEIPQDTHFLAGMHNTTTDEVTLYDLVKLPSSHQPDLATLQQQLKEAGHLTRKARAHLLGLQASDPKVEAQVKHRACDWSELRPEWGLAGNAAFIAAPRARTRGRDLGGRVFLHDYDTQHDLDNSLLVSILSAPLIVANWINLQYYASAVNNPVFGSGNKVLHNIVGTLGVCLGNSGDLQVGLPLQSVHDGKRFIHEPLRLHALIAAPISRLEAALAKSAEAYELVEHEWILLFALHDDGTLSRRLPGGRWV